jgi:hypothetical protein
VDRAAPGGHIDTLDWLLQAQCTSSAFDGAAAAGSLMSLQWLHKNTDVIGTTRAMDRAMASGNLEVVRWIHENRAEKATFAGLGAAISGGHFELREYVRRNQIVECPQMAYLGAVKGRWIYDAAWIRRHYAHLCDSDETENGLFQRNDWTLSIMQYAGLS